MCLTVKKNQLIFLPLPHLNCIRLSAIATSTEENNIEENNTKHWGEDVWIGRAVCKDFGKGFGKFRGHVTDVDDYAGKKGRRLFHVEYEDGDEEWLDAQDTEKILLVSCF